MEFGLLGTLGLEEPDQKEEAVALVPFFVFVKQSMNRIRRGPK